MVLLNEQASGLNTILPKFRRLQNLPARWVDLTSGSRRHGNVEQKFIGSEFRPRLNSVCAGDEASK